METIIARQSIARRRRPFAPISGAGGKHPSGEGPGISAWRQHPARRKPVKAKPAPPPLPRGRLFETSDHKQPRKPRWPGLFLGLARLVSALKAHAASRPGMGDDAFVQKGFIPLLLPPPQKKSAEDPAGLNQEKPTAHRVGARVWVDLLGPSAKIAGAALVLSLVGLAILSLVHPSFPLPKGQLLPATSTAGPTETDPLLDYLSPELILSTPELDLQALPIPKALELSTYKVRSGDSLGGIAKRYGLAIDSLVSLNGIKSIQNLKVGTELKVPNMDGLLHIVTRGQSLGSIAKAYKIDLTILADANDLGSGSIHPGETLFIPGARLPPETLKRLYGTTVIWPVRGPISSWFGYRADPFTGVRRFHAGMDIVVATGSPVKTAIDGVVADLGYNANYGNYVILNHGGGLQTLYAHLTSYSVRAGQRLSQGFVLGLSGNTGYSTGPHLHFGVYRGGVAIDPRKVLK